METSHQTAVKVKSERELERIVKGVANHRRIQILRLLAKEPELSLEGICSRVKIDVKTGWEHVRRMAIAGIVLKRSEGRSVRHRLSSRGDNILTFLGMLE
jgi:predicted transcriptional regulator